MFHRPRQGGIQVRPLMAETPAAAEAPVSPTEAPVQETAASIEPATPEPAPAAQQAEPVTAPVATPEQSQHFQPQPTQQKEAVSMSNYNNTPFNNADAPAEGAAPQMPAASSFSPRPAGAMQPVRSPYAYGQSSYGTDASVSTGRKLVIGEGITMSGEIEACDHLVVEGTVEASLKGASVLDVSQSGMFFGAVEINEATVAGRFEGDLVVNGRLTVRATGVITGTLSYKELAVEAGATIDGKITPMREGRVVTAEKKSQAPKQQQQGAKSADAANELPFAGKNQANAAA